MKPLSRRKPSYSPLPYQMDKRPFFKMEGATYIVQ